MHTRVVELFPTPGAERPLRGLYLEHELHRMGSREAPYIYANFVSSLDGRIALLDPATGRGRVPEDLTSASDFRLFMELHAQADCIVTHGGYLRSLAEGSLGNVLQVGGEHEDLARWRVAQGFAPQPAVIVVSASLDFPLPESVRAHRQSLHILTSANADHARLRAWERQGIPLHVAESEGSVEARPLAALMGDLGLRTGYLVTGPLMLETVLRQQVLASLYLTITHQVLGGDAFHSMVRGPALGVAGRLRMRSLYYDAEAPAGAGQWFARFERAPAESA